MLYILYDGKRNEFERRRIRKRMKRTNGRKHTNECVSAFMMGVLRYRLLNTVYYDTVHVHAFSVCVYSKRWHARVEIEHSVDFNIHVSYILSTPVYFIRHAFREKTLTL